MVEPIEVRHLGIGDLDALSSIDRSERVDAEYTVRDGRIIERPVSMTEIPNWDPVGTGPYSLTAQVAYCQDLIERGAFFIGAFDGTAPIGLAAVDVRFEPSLAWLAFLYVSRPHRRRGVASALWAESTDLARAADATSIYVSAVPTGSAVGFYRSRGCGVVDPVHPKLYAEEPEDIHLVCALDPGR